MRWRTIFTLSKTTVLLADCRAVANKAESFRFPPERIKIFPWGVDLDFFVPTGTAPLRRRLKWQKAWCSYVRAAWNHSTAWTWLYGHSPGWQPANPEHACC